MLVSCSKGTFTHGAIPYPRVPRSIRREASGIPIVAIGSYVGFCSRNYEDMGYGIVSLTKLPRFTLWNCIHAAVSGPIQIPRV